MNVNLTPYVKANVVADCDVAAAEALIGLVERKGEAVPDLLGTLLLCLALRGHVRSIAKAINSKTGKAINIDADILVA